ncbi:MAG: hypothetical protein DMF93_09590, partial [Acidobacteria bacterium]
MRRLGDVELGEELRDARRIGRADEPLAVQHRDPLAIGEDAEVGIGDLRLERAQLLLRKGEDRRILHGDEAIVDAFRD